MTLLRFAPEIQKHANGFRSIASMMNEMLDVDPGRTMTSKPMANIFENENEFRIELSVPGYPKEKINMQIDNQVLTITGELQKDENKHENYRRVEFNYEGFERSFTLSDNIDSDKVTAEYKDGILSIVLPIREESKPKTKNISIS